MGWLEKREQLVQRKFFVPVLLSLVCLISLSLTFLSRREEYRGNPIFGSTDRETSTRPPTSRESHWVDIWSAIPQSVEAERATPPPLYQEELAFANSTIRQTIRNTLAAEQIRIRFSNAFGLEDLPITKVTIALPKVEPDQTPTGSGSIDVETLQTLTFGEDDASIIIPPGGLAVSHAVDFPIDPGQVISISIYLREGHAGQSITVHPISLSTSWFAFGDQTETFNIAAPGTRHRSVWYFVSAVEGWKSSDHRAFAVVGDSITDGTGSTLDMNHRWPDRLFERMQFSSDPKLHDISVINQGSAGNAILQSGIGPNAISRIDRDVLVQSGVKYAMLFEGVNDIGHADRSEEDQTRVGDRLIKYYEQIITRVHEFGIPIFGSTISPFNCQDGSLTLYSRDPIREKTRLRLNEWIRNSGWFDAVVDFDAVLRNPDNHTQLAAPFDSGDCLHPSDAGYLEMAASFPLDVFEKFRDGVSTFE